MDATSLTSLFSVSKFENRNAKRTNNKGKMDITVDDENRMAGVNWATTIEIDPILPTKEIDLDYVS
jgi:hypothetical protein